MFSHRFLLPGESEHMDTCPLTLQSPQWRGGTRELRSRGAGSADSLCWRPSWHCSQGPLGQPIHHLWEPREMCPATCRTGHTRDPRVIPIISKVRGPVQLSHSHTQQSRERVGPRTGCTQTPPPGVHSQNLPQVASQDRGAHGPCPQRLRPASLGLPLVSLRQSTPNGHIQGGSYSRGRRGCDAAAHLWGE